MGSARFSARAGGIDLLLLAGLMTAAGASAAAAEVTFTRDVAPILHARCVSCHRPGEAAPMPLRTFAEARPYARAIKDRVVSRRMPPWPADRAVGRFTNDPSLTDAGVAAGPPRPHAPGARVRGRLAVG
jgi:hypothetical protein